MQIRTKQVLAPFFLDGSWAKPVKQNQPWKRLGPTFLLDEGMNRKGVEEIMTYTIELITVAYLGLKSDSIFGFAIRKIAGSPGANKDFGVIFSQILLWWYIINKETHAPFGRIFWYFFQAVK